MDQIILSRRIMGGVRGEAWEKEVEAVEVDEKKGVSTISLTLREAYYYDVYVFVRL